MPERQSPPSTQMPNRPRSRVLALRVLIAAILLVVVGLAAGYVTLGESGAYDGMQLPWYVLLVLFIAVEATVLHVQVRREAQTVSMSEIPLVLGLFLADPTVVILTRVMGSFLVYAFYRRQSPLKLAFNLALAFAEASVGIAVFHIVAGNADAVSGHAWLAAYAAVMSSSLLSALAVSMVIVLYEGGFRFQDLQRAVNVGLPIACLTTTLGLIATNCLILSTNTAWLLAAGAVICVLTYRAYAALADRHLSLERLYQFSQAVGSAPEVDDVIRSVLAQARDLLRAESADLILLPEAGATSGRRLTYDGARLTRHEAPEMTSGSWLRRQVIDGGDPQLIPRTHRDPAARAYLTDRGVDEALAAPLRGAHGVVGAVVVADRMGSVRTFSLDDVKLLETVANHAAVALENGHLVDQLRHDALHDALTGLPNRSRLEAVVDEQLALYSAGASQGLALLLMDLDRFKEVNDTLGHLHGDLLLREVGDRLLATVPEGALVARLGGDEFAVVLPGLADQAGAEQVARTLLTALEVPTTIEHVELEIGASIGVALAPLDGTLVGDLLKCADVAMYAAKSSGRGVESYRISLDQNEPARLVMGTELRAALAQDEIEVHAQPKAELASGKVTGVELLLRWRHPIRGLIAPEDFIPVAERTGLLRPLTATVLGEGIAACAAWLAQGVELGIAVNLSTRSLLDPELVEDVLALLEHHGVPPGLLTLEITEGSVMSDLAGTTTVLDRLHDAGVRLSVDDFGTGYSSLSYLSRLPVDEVKIDKLFVLGMREDEQDAAIVRSVIDLGTSLGLQVVAEGVEDEATWTRLAALGCDQAQGWFLSHPLPLADVLPFVDSYLPYAGLRALPTRRSLEPGVRTG
ncbi:MAG: EAL domain-containing protein [Mycobacteriales bacterium]